MLIFDLETGQEPEETLRSLYREQTYEEFAVECDQRWKDETKREKYETSKSAGWTKFVERAALSPLTGRILAIGFKNAKGVRIEDGKGDEAALIRHFWNAYSLCRGKRNSLAGWNIHGFDLPFLVRRSWKHGIEIPQGVRDTNDRYWDGLLVDLMVRFSVGEWKAHVKLDVAARYFGVGEKPADVGGADFARLWFGTKEEREKAIGYLSNDLAMTASVAERMGMAV